MIDQFELRNVILDVPNKDAKVIFQPYQLVSLWDMLRVFAHEYIELGRNIENASLGFSFNESTAEDKDDLKDHLLEIKEICKKLNLPVSLELVTNRINDLPQTDRELELILEAVHSELKSQLFMFIPSYRAIYHENDSLVSEEVKRKFPSVTSEIRAAGNSFAAGLSTACVFHSMRAAEIGVRVLSKYLDITGTKPIELWDWAAILNAINGKIQAIENEQATTERNDKLTFCSQAAAQFRFFKSAWRNDVAHAHAIYNESQAKEVIDHVRSFFETLASHLSE